MPRAPIRVRAAAGAAAGSVFAVFTPILAATWLFRGAEVTIARGLVRVDLLTLLYPLGAVIAGALLCILLPYGRGRIGGALLGAISLLPWIAAIAWCMDRGYAQWQVSHTILTFLVATLLGAPLGWHLGAFTQRARDGTPTSPVANDSAAEHSGP